MVVTTDCTVELWNLNRDKINRYDKIGNQKNGDRVCALFENPYLLDSKAQKDGNKNN